MFETYRMLGREREVELLREAHRLHRAPKRAGTTRRAQRTWALVLALAALIAVGAARALAPSPEPTTTRTETQPRPIEIVVSDGFRWKDAAVGAAAAAGLSLVVLGSAIALRGRKEPRP